MSGSKKPARSTQTAHMLKRSVCITLRCSGLGNGKKVSPGTLDMAVRKADGGSEAVSDTAKRSVSVTKQLVDNSDLRACHKALDAAKSWLASVAVNSHRVFGPGTYLLPLAKVDEAEAKLPLLRADVRVAAAALADRWDAIVEKRREDLGPVFNAADYATRDEVLAEWDIDWDYVTFAAPDSLEEVSKAAYHRALEKDERRFSAAYEEVVGALYEDAQRVVAELAERLADDADGKKKTIRGTALRDLSDYVERLPARAGMVKDDATRPLQAALAKVSALAEGLDVETLRKADGVRAQLRQEAGAAAQALAAMVEARGRRSFGLTGAGRDVA